MGQLEDFRASLKRKDSAESSEGEIPVKSIAKEKQEKMKRRTLGVSGELHLELKALSVRRRRSSSINSASEGCPIGSGMTERRADIPSGSFLLFTSLLNGGTGGDFLQDLRYCTAFPCATTMNRSPDGGRFLFHLFLHSCSIVPFSYSLFPFLQ